MLKNKTKFTIGLVVVTVMAGSFVGMVSGVGANQNTIYVGNETHFNSTEYPNQDVSAQTYQSLHNAFNNTNDDAVVYVQSGNFTLGNESITDGRYNLTESVNVTEYNVTVQTYNSSVGNVTIDGTNTTSGKVFVDNGSDSINIGDNVTTLNAVLGGSGFGGLDSEPYGVPMVVWIVVAIVVGYFGYEEFAE